MNLFCIHCEKGKCGNILLLMLCPTDFNSASTEVNGDLACTKADKEDGCIFP